MAPGHSLHDCAASGEHDVNNPAKVGGIRNSG